VQLLVADGEPDAAARPQPLGLGQLGEAEQIAVERARGASPPAGAATWTWSMREIMRSA
jgi:hypothetical protein